MHVAASAGRTVAGRYLLQQPIGHGAMGTVWRARDTVLARDVAVKEVRVRGAASSDETRVLYERTLREARTAARLNHPAVVTVFDVVEADGSPWIVMELVEARSLEQVLATSGPLSPHRAAELGIRLLGALECAHAAGILHRDVKPSNVLLGPDGRAVLTDFGIATLDGEPGLTQTGMVLGTPGFTPPERVRGELASPASDLWSLGATLYAAVEGHGPFDRAGSSMAVLAAVAHEEAPPARSAGALQPAIAALLRRDPQARPDAAAAGARLAAAARGGQPGSQGGPVPAGRDRAPSTTPGGPPPAGPDRAPSTLPGGQPSARPGHLAAQPPVWIPPEGPDRLPPEGPDRLPPLKPEADRAAGPSPRARPRPGPTTRRPSGRAALLTALAGLAVLAAGLLAGLAWAHRDSTGRAPPYRSYQGTTGPAGSAGPATGFTMSLPGGWRMARSGASAVFTSPSGGATMHVTPTVIATPRAVGTARLLEFEAVRQQTLPGYRRVTLHQFLISGRTGAVWQFTWQPGTGGRAEVLDALFRSAGPTGLHAYLLQERAPAATWTANQAIFTEALRTFQPRR
jgi:eukaryotic-like serine/threonine-protein kinase